MNKRNSVDDREVLKADLQKFTNNDPILLEFFSKIYLQECKSQEKWQIDLFPKVSFPATKNNKK